MNVTISGFVVSLLVAAAWYAERAAEALGQGLFAANRLRHAVLIDPRTALPEHCAAAKHACKLQLAWRTSAEANTFADVCIPEAPSSPDDPRLRPRRYYRLRLECPAIVPGQGSKSLLVTFIGP